MYTTNLFHVVTHFQNSESKDIVITTVQGKNVAEDILKILQGKKNLRVTYSIRLAERW